MSATSVPGPRPLLLPLLVLVVAAAPVSAQVCAGFAPLDRTRFRASVSAASYSYADALGASLAVGRDRFATVGVSRGLLWKVVDAEVIDGAVNGAGAVVQTSAGWLRRLQTGSVRVYAVSVLLGVVLVLGYYVWRYGQVATF